MGQHCQGVHKKVFLPKTGIPGHFGAKNRYILKPSTNHTLLLLYHDMHPAYEAAHVVARAGPVRGP